ncbi:MAG: 2-hydroxyglutaryl-CoA dehydratase [Deltaproteobacteria bacterium RBG_16_54_11]|jgi:predicted CoA-substrate-specific enzyme activase|nr:MAG: 2-hydroxyglutaryl-CoA dehydratase [Deltaproteobacteria bacterium RBG_16_54_11]
MIAAGIDIGSLSTEAIVFDNEKGILGYSIVLTGGSSKEASRVSLKQAIGSANITRDQIKRIVSTGCAREIAEFADRKITEITCIAKGVSHLFPECRTIIDIGGQDTKVIRVDGKGRVLEFDMNDKCAAGTGRFLEVMAKALTIGLDEMGEQSLRYRNDLAISSICTVFAESEVVSLVSEGRQVEDILHAIHNAVADRTLGLLERIGAVEPPVAMTGGVAKNIGVVKALEEKLKTPLAIYAEPQIVGSLGAALLALNGL